MAGLPPAVKTAVANGRCHAGNGLSGISLVRPLCPGGVGWGNVMSGGGGGRSSGRKKTHVMSRGKTLCPGGVGGTLCRGGVGGGDVMSGGGGDVTSRENKNKKKRYVQGRKNAMSRGEKTLCPGEKTLCPGEKNVMSRGGKRYVQGENVMSREEKEAPSHRLLAVVGRAKQTSSFL